MSTQITNAILHTTGNIFKTGKVTEHSWYDEECSDARGHLQPEINSRDSYAQDCNSSV